MELRDGMLAITVLRVFAQNTTKASGGRATTGIKIQGGCKQES
jgi:hypothetical protein